MLQAYLSGRKLIQYACNMLQYISTDLSGRKLILIQYADNMLQYRSTDLSGRKLIQYAYNRLTICYNIDLQT
jgi:hypothetical protein